MTSVLHIISGVDPISGGPVTTLSGMARAQARRGMDVHVAAMLWEDNAGVQKWVADAAADGVKTTLIGPTKKPMLWHASTHGIIEELVGKVDLVHMHGMWKHVHAVTSRLCIKAKVPYVIRPAGMLTQGSLGSKSLKKSLYLAFGGSKIIKHASALQFTCEMERDLSKTYGVTTLIEPNGVDLREFEQENLPEAGELRRKFPEIGDRRIVLFLGRLHPIKGLDILLPAFAKADLDDTVLVLAGPDADGYGAKVDELIQANSLKDRVVLTGMLNYDERVGALQDAELFTLSSYHENFGNVVVEALAANTPVVISDKVNIHPYISANGVGGVVPLEVDAFAAEIKRWMSDKALYDEAQRRAKPYVWEAFDWDKIAGRLESYYKTIFDQGRG